MNQESRHNAASCKTHLGNAVYAEIEHSLVKLTTSDGLRETNTIYMDKDVLRALERWLRQRDLIDET